VPNGVSFGAVSARQWTLRDSTAQGAPPVHWTGATLRSVCRKQNPGSSVARSGRTRVPDARLSRIPDTSVPLIAMATGKLNLLPVCLGGREWSSCQTTQQTARYQATRPLACTPASRLLLGNRMRPGLDLLGVTGYRT
jgi:hypothetical protein